MRAERPVLCGLFILVFGSCLHADLGFYIIPVTIDRDDGTSLSGTLKFYGDQIRGKKGEKEHVLAFGWNGVSTEKRVIESVSYDFSRIEVKGRRVIVSFEKGRTDEPMNKYEYEIEEVSFFFSDKGLIVYENADVDKCSCQTIPMNKIRSVKRTGAVHNRVCKDSGE